MSLGGIDTSNEMPPKGQNDKKSWMDLRLGVREVRRRLSNLSTKVPSCFVFRSVQLGEVSKTRLYFLSALVNGRETTLLYVDIPDFTLDPIPVLTWYPLLESTFQVMPTLGQVSKEEQLQWERKRLVTWGITSYEVHCSSGQFVFPACSSLFSCIDNDKAWNAPYFPTELKSTFVGARLNPQICPTNHELVAYVCNSDIWVQHIASGSERRLTFAHKGSQSLVNDPLSAGIPSYVTQEEFNRYTGFWWQPQSQNPSVYIILYEEVDESEVEILHFASPNSEDRGVEEYRFPRAGTPNSKSTLKMLEFEVEENGQIINLKHLQMQDSLQELFPWMEYIVRIGWHPSGKFVWAQLLNRRQQHLQLLLIPLTLFVSLELVFEIPSNHVNSSPIEVLFVEESDIWINVHDILHFFPQQDDHSISFIWASERTGFRHLYYIKGKLGTSLVNNQQDNTINMVDGTEYMQFYQQYGYNSPWVPTNYSFASTWGPQTEWASSKRGFTKPQIIRETQLTHGDWEVLDKQIWVDEYRQLVYFMGFTDSPLEKHLYVVSLTAPGHVRKLTELGYSHVVQLNKECTMFVTVYSSIKSLPASQVFHLVFPDNANSVDSIKVIPVGYLLEPSVPEHDYQQPELFRCPVQNGETLYGMVFKPPYLEPGRKYPTVLSVYGGPEVQLVTNTFKGMRQLRLHMLADQGYVVVVIDSRGSRHRGLKFESHLKEKMGTVEIADQVEALQWLAKNVEYIDLSRVAIHGWSYGGYLSLMALAQRPDVFKIAIAGAPVTSWSLYDTGYTERYMDTPSVNSAGYKNGSVLSYVNLFPNEENRLLIIHGLIDENVHFFHTSQLINALVRAGKPYQLQIYPNERHSLRHLDASEHYETTLLSFLQTWL